MRACFKISSVLLGMVVGVTVGHCTSLWQASNSTSYGSAALDPCALSGGYDPNCVAALGDSATFTPYFGGLAQPTPAMILGCPLCQGYQESMSNFGSVLQATNGLDMGGLVIAATNSWMSWFMNRGSATNVFPNVMPGTPTPLTQVIPYDTSSVCVVVDPATQAVQVVGGNVGVSVDTFLGMTNFPDTVARDVVMKQYFAGVAVSNWMSGAAGGAANLGTFTAGNDWSNVTYYWSNVFVYPYSVSITGLNGQVVGVASDAASYVSGYATVLDQNPGTDVGESLGDIRDQLP